MCAADLVSGSLVLDDVRDREAAEEVSSALEWAEARAMAADGLSKREIARRPGSTGGLRRCWSGRMSRQDIRGARRG